mgnify:CR=1 FL=1
MFDGPQANGLAARECENERVTLPVCQSAQGLCAKVLLSIGVGLFPLRAAHGLPSDQVARGRYLATAICECLECHSPLQPGGLEIPIASKLGAGDILDEKLRVVAPNITPDL